MSEAVDSVEPGRQFSWKRTVYNAVDRELFTSLAESSKLWADAWRISLITAVDAEIGELVWVK